MPDPEVITDDTPPASPPVKVPAPVETYTPPFQPNNLIVAGILIERAKGFFGPGTSVPQNVVGVLLAQDAIAQLGGSGPDLNWP